jgi:hypothetical protein
MKSYLIASTAFVCMWENIFVSWIGMCHLEVAILKALLLFKFSWISGMNDLFLGRSLLLINVASQVVTQTFRFWLGSMHESREFQVLSGIKVSYTEIYWTICPIVFLIIVAISYTIISVKKILELFKDYQTQKMGKVSIAMLESAQSTYSGTASGTASRTASGTASATSTPLLLNTTKYNPAIFNGLHICVLMGIGVIYVIIHIVVMEHFKSSQFVPYETWLFLKLFIELFLTRLGYIYFNGVSVNQIMGMMN